jgi:hypothetical protein
MKNPHAVALGKIGGSKKTIKKRKSSQKNGLKGGRPKKVISFIGFAPLEVDQALFQPIKFDTKEIHKRNIK